MSTDLFAEAQEVQTKETTETIVTDEMLMAVSREGIDTSADFETPIPPPIAGKYLAKVKLTEKGIERKIPASKVTYLLANVYFRLLDSQGNETDFSVYPDKMEAINSVKSPYSATTRLDDLLNKLGHPTDSTWNLLQVEQHAKTILGAGDGIVQVAIEWKAGRKPSAEELKANPKQTWILLSNKMTDFPKNEDGTHQNWIEFNGEKCWARPYIVHILKANA